MASHFTLPALSTLALCLLFSTSQPAAAWIFGTKKDIDFSSQDALKDSVSTYTKDMGQEEKELFGRAIMGLMMERHPVVGAAPEGLPRMMAMGALGDNFMDGMSSWMKDVTVEDIRAKMADITRVVEANAQREKQQADEKAEKQRAEDAKQLATQAQQACLQQKITLPYIAVEQQRYSEGLTFQLKNDLPFAISGIKIEYVIRENGRSVPVHKDDGIFSFSGGVEPGETRSFDFYYHGPSAAGKQFTIDYKVLNAFDAEERALVDLNVRYLDRTNEISPHKCG